MKKLRKAESERLDVPHGTLDLLILKTLETLGPQHGWGLARRLEQVSDDVLALNQGTLYPALLRLEQRGWIRPAWGRSENNRRAKFYSLTKRGERQLEVETRNWLRTTSLVHRVLAGG
ncbi:MAG: PadR family transcriptional regulator [Acidobacteriota bacterium]